jgi:pentapeptide repeat protein
LLGGAELQGAELGSQLQGASLKEATLQGADFRSSTLAGTNMSGAVVWRTAFGGASLTAVFEDDLHESAISRDDFAALKATIMKEVPQGNRREEALERIEKLNPDIFGPEASEQETLEKGRVDEPTYKKSLADELKRLACSRDADAVYIVRGLIGFEFWGSTLSIITLSIIKDTGAQAPGLVEAILKPDCPVSAALTDADKAALEKLKKEASGAH